MNTAILQYVEVTSLDIMYSKSLVIRNIIQLASTRQKKNLAQKKKPAQTNTISMQSVLVAWNNPHTTELKKQLYVQLFVR